MKTLIIACALLTTATSAFAQNPMSPTTPAPIPPGQMQQDMPSDQTKTMGDMMGMMKMMMPMMESMQKSEMTTANRTEMMQKIAPMMQQMMPMMQTMTNTGAVPIQMGNTPPHTRDYMQVMDKMNGPMMIAAKATNPDEAFVRGMIPHHQGAIDMAKIVLQSGKDEMVRKWANDVIREQQREISEMESWLKQTVK